MALYRCSAGGYGNRTSWGPVTSPLLDPKCIERPLSGNFDRIFNVFERTNAFEYVRSTFEGGKEREERNIGHGDRVVNKRVESSFERADVSLAAQSPCGEEDLVREKARHSQDRQLYPLQEDLAEWINRTIGSSHITGENFLDALDNGAELCQLAAVIHDRAREAKERGLFTGTVPRVLGRCWQRAARRSFFSRDNANNFLTFCRELGVHENLLFESDDLVLHNQPRQVILCLLEVARLATKFDVEPPGLVQLEKEIALEEQDYALDSTVTSAWQFREASPLPKIEGKVAEESKAPVLDNADAESTNSGSTAGSSENDVPLKPTNELDKGMQLVTRLVERGCRCGARCSRMLKVRKVGEGRYNIAGRNYFIRLLNRRHMMVRVGGGWETLEHFLSRHEPCQVRLVARRAGPSPLTLSTTSSVGALTPLNGHSPVDSRTSTSPVANKPLSDGKRSPDSRLAPKSSDQSRISSRTSSGMSSPDSRLTPSKSIRSIKSALTLPLSVNKSATPKIRKQSAPAFSTPATPTGRLVSTPPKEQRKSISAIPIATPKKSRSMSLALQKDEKVTSVKKNNILENRNKSVSVSTTPTSARSPRVVRSRSLATTPVNVPKKTFNLERVNPKKFRSLSLVTPELDATQLSLEENIRLSIEANMEEDNVSKRAFLHIKAKYRSLPPREVPPR